MAKANVVKRIVAYLIDGFVGGLIIAVVIMASLVVFMGGMVGGAALESVLVTLATSAIYVVGILVALLLFFIFFLTKDCLFGGRGVGKRLMGLKVVNVKEKRPCSVKESAIRNLLLILPIIGFVEIVMALVDAEGLRFGDKIAGTQVVDNK